MVSELEKLKGATAAKSITPSSTTSLSFFTQILQIHAKMTHYDPHSGSWVCGTVKVSEEDAALLRECEYNSVLSVTDSITAAWKSRLAEMKTQRLQPYADLLFTEIVNTMRQSHERREWLDRMKMRAKSADSERDIYWDVHLYNHVEYMEPLSALKQRQSTMTPEELQAHREKQAEVRQYITHRRLKDHIGTSKMVMDEEDEEVVEVFPLRLESVDAVVRHTDLLKRLALEFGGPFCYANVKTIKTQTDAERGILILTKAINIYYKPFGPSKEHLASTLDFLKKDKLRAKRTLDDDEYLKFGAPICRCLGCRRFQ